MPLCSTWVRSLTVAALCSTAILGESSVIHTVEVRGTKRQLQLETVVGQPLEPEKVARDVRRLWTTGWFEDLRVETTDTPSGMDVVFQAIERPRLFLRRIVVDPRREEHQIKAQPGTPVDIHRARRIAAFLRGRLTEQGYVDAKVEPELAPVGSHQADLLLRVDRDLRYGVGEVRFTGASGFETKDLQQALRATRVRRVLFWKSRPPFSEPALDADLERLRSWYFSRGYFDARVQAGRVDYLGDKAIVNISIESGRRYDAGNIEITGFRDTQRLPATQLCRCLLDTRREAEREGRLDFGVHLELVGRPPRAAAGPLADLCPPGSEAPQAGQGAGCGPGAPPHQELNLHATIDAGPAYTVGRIEFRGNHSVRDSTLRRSLALQEGAPLDRDLLRRSLARVNRMNLFDPVTEDNVTILPNPSSRRADVIVPLEQLSRGRWTISGPVGPPGFAGPLQAGIAARLPAWGRGILEGSTYYGVLSVSAFSPPILRLLSLSHRNEFLPLAVLERPYLPGQCWQSGLLLSLQLGLKETAARYGLTHIQALAAPALRGDSALTPPLVVPVERGPALRSAGSIICEKPPPKWSRLRAAGALALNWMLAARPF